jgi:nitrite reductase/ring-hydroxylating ferredoxin subunit
MKNNNKRREFLKSTGKVAGFGLFAGAFGSVINSCEQDELPPKPKPGDAYDLDLNLHSELLSPGGNKVLSLDKINGGDPVLIKHLSDDTFIVMDAICRHQNCNVSIPDTSDGLMVCLCHGAVFSFEDGKVIDNKGFSAAKDMTIFNNVYDATKKLLTISAG